MPTTKIRRDERTSRTLCIVALVVMVTGFTFSLYGQSQDAVNARTDERIAAINDRLNRLENQQTYGLTAIALNIGAHLFQIKANYGRRRLRSMRRDDEDGD